MDTLRCPTCFTLLLEGGERRCPACHTKLRNRRGQPVVLGESARLSNRPTPWDRELKARAEAVHQTEEAQSRQLTSVGSSSRIDTAPEPELMAQLVFEPEPERRTEVMIDLTTEHALDPRPEVTIDLTAEHALDAFVANLSRPAPEPVVATVAPAAAPVAETAPRPEPAAAPVAASPLGDLNDMVAELYRKARADD